MLSNNKVIKIKKKKKRRRRENIHKKGGMEGKKEIK